MSTAAPITVRPAVPAEAGRIAEIAKRAYSVYVERIGRRPRPMDDDYEPKVRRGEVFVADENGRTVGLIVLVDAGDHLLVENIAVVPEHQHRGLGRSLLAYAEAHALELQHAELRLYTNEAMTENRRLYRRLGYAETGRQGQDGFSRVFFRKRIASAAEEVRR